MEGCQRQRIITIWMITMIVLCVQAFASPQSVFEFSRLEKSSDVIAALEVQTIENVDIVEKKLANGQDIQCQRVLATCVVHKALKGAVQENAVLPVYFLGGTNGTKLGWEELRQGETAIVFLIKKNDGKFYFADERRAKISLAKYVPLTDVEHASLRDWIGKELLAQFDGTNAPQLQTILNSVRSIEYTVPRKRLETFLESTDPNIRALSLSQLVNQHERFYIPKAVELILKEEELTPIIRNQLAWTLEQNANIVHESEAILLAKEPDEKIRRIGIRILRQIGSDDSIPILMGALDSKNKDTQYSAIVGLSRITKRAGASWREFQAKPDEEISKWKNWWRNTEKGKDG